MSHFNFTGYIIFAFITSITPGPNNYLLLSTGKQFSLAQSLKVMNGIFWGFSSLLIIAGYGLAQLFFEIPLLNLIFKILCSVWLLYLAYALSKIHVNSVNEKINKIGFAESFIMQFINPKAWIMALTAAGSFMPIEGNLHINVIIFTFTFGLIGIPCMLCWVKAGELMSRFIQTEKANKILGIILFLLMMLGIFTIWY